MEELLAWKREFFVVKSSARCAPSVLARMLGIVAWPVVPRSDSMKPGSGAGPAYSMWDPRGVHRAVPAGLGIVRMLGIVACKRCSGGAT